jgi:hypothetical protein
MVNSGAQNQFTVTSKDATGKINTGFAGTVSLRTRIKLQRSCLITRLPQRKRESGNSRLSLKTQGKHTIMVSSDGSKSAAPSMVVK